MDENSNFIFDLEDQIQKICKSFSLNNSNQEYNLIEALRPIAEKQLKKKLERDLIQT